MMDARGFGGRRHRLSICISVEIATRIDQATAPLRRPRRSTLGRVCAADQTRQAFTFETFWNFVATSGLGQSGHRNRRTSGYSNLIMAASKWRHLLNE